MSSMPPCESSKAVARWIASREPIFVGIGPVARWRMRSESGQQFWSFCGLGIVTRVSAEWALGTGGSFVRRKVPSTRGLSPRYNRVLKNVFKGAAKTIIPTSTTTRGISVFALPGEWCPISGASHIQAYKYQHNNIGYLSANNRRIEQHPSRITNPSRLDLSRRWGQGSFILEITPSRSTE